MKIFRNIKIIYVRPTEFVGSFSDLSSYRRMYGDNCHFFIRSYDKTYDDYKIFLSPLSADQTAQIKIENDLIFLYYKIGSEKFLGVILQITSETKVIKC